MSALAGIREWLVTGRIWGKAGTAESDRIAAADSRLRALPKEEIYVWRKTIDNSRVVRVVDQEDRRTSFGAAIGAPIAAALVIAMLLPGGYNLLARRQYEKLMVERADLVNQLKEVSAVKAKLLSAENIERWAGKELQTPRKNAVVYANPSGSALAKLQGASGSGQ